MKRILIVEDDPLIADSLEVIVQETGYECIGKVDTVKDALMSVADLAPDLLLLDINLEGNREGLDIAEIVYKREKIPYIFITAYSDESTVTRGAATEPMGYLIKPFSQADVRVALKLAFAAIDKQETKMSSLIDGDGTFYVKESNGYKRIQIKDIRYVKADDIYSIIVTHDQRCIISKSLKKVEAEFVKYGFIRVHRSYLINKVAVDQIKDSHVIIGNETIPIGRAYKEELMKQLKVL